jgi:hypothetical protein
MCVRSVWTSLARRNPARPTYEGLRFYLRHLAAPSCPSAGRKVSVVQMPLARFGLPIALAVSLAVGVVALSQHGAPAADCEEPTIRCATFAAPQFDPAGGLWVAWSSPRHVGLASSRDDGKSFGPDVLVNRAPLRIDTGADARPQLVFDRAGAAVVAFTIRKDDQFNGQVLIARSNRQRTAFLPPAPVSAHAASQRFVTLSTDANGGIFAAWIDKRREGPAAGLPETEGASVAYAWSSDGGATFSPAVLAHAGMCECCRLATTLTADGRPVIAFRDVVQGVRDHAVVTFTAPAAPGRARPVAADLWKIDGCPHHGPSLALGPDGEYHFVWFTNGQGRTGAFYARSRDEGRTWSAPMPLSSREETAQRPAVAVAAHDVWLAWKEQTGATAKAFVRSSADGGRSWSSAREVAASAGSSDHPLLVVRGGRAYLSWLSRDEGYRLIPLSPRP